MVCLSLHHIKLHAPGPAGEVRRLFVEALGAVECTAAPPTRGELVVNLGGLSQLVLCGVDNSEEPTSEAASLLAEAFGSRKSGSSTSAPHQTVPRPLAGHVETWTLEPLEVVYRRLQAALGPAGPNLIEGGDERLLFTCPWGNNLLVRRAPDGFVNRGALPGGHGKLAALSRAVIAVNVGTAAGIRSFFVTVLGSACDLKHAGPADAGVDYCIAHFGSGQQVVFEERELADDKQQCGEAGDAGDRGGEASGRRVSIAMYVQSREAFRAAFIACGSAGLLTDPQATWEDAESGGAFRAWPRAPPTRSHGSSSTAAPALTQRQLGRQPGDCVELELRSICHPHCPQGIGRRCGSGRMPGGFGDAARQLASASSRGTGSAGSRRSLPPRAPAAKVARTSGPRQPSPRKGASSPRPSSGGGRVGAKRS
jgi:hypothetical protein